MGSSKSKSTQSSTPWGPAAGYLQNGLGYAQTGYNQAESALGQVSPMLSTALNNVMGLTNNKTLTDANSTLDDFISGKMLGANPYASSLADQVAGKANNSWASTTGASGRSGGGLAALLQGQGVGDALQEFYSNQYNTDRANQLQAIGLSPSIQSAQLAPYSTLGQLGALAVGLPQQVSGNYASQVQGIAEPYKTTTTKTKQGGGIGSILGPALGIAGSFLMPGVGTALGSAVGGAAGGGLASGIGSALGSGMGSSALSGLLAGL